MENNTERDSSFLFDVKEPKIIDAAISVDDRGSLTYCNSFYFEGVKRAYMVENHRQGFIRAFHGHKFEGKYVQVV